MEDRHGSRGSRPTGSSQGTAFDSMIQTPLSWSPRSASMRRYVTGRANELSGLAYACVGTASKYQLFFGAVESFAAMSSSRLKYGSRPASLACQCEKPGMLTLAFGLACLIAM